MIKSNTYEMRCIYCGRFINLDEDICDCGKGVGYVMEDKNGRFEWIGLNNIDNILEYKRAQMKRRDTYRIG